MRRKEKKNGVLMLKKLQKKKTISHKILKKPSLVYNGGENRIVVPDEAGVSHHSLSWCTTTKTTTNKEILGRGVDTCFEGLAFLSALIPT